MTCDQYVAALHRELRSSSDKLAAHLRCHPILLDMSGDSALFRAILEQHILKPGSLNATHYPVVALDIHEIDGYDGLVANCWLPLPGRETHVSIKSIHDHASWILTTITIFGPGYEHWTFTRPEPLDRAQQLYAMEVRERSPHPLHHVAVVEADVPHLPFYPPSLTVTLSFWTNQSPKKGQSQTPAEDAHQERQSAVTACKDGPGENVQSEDVVEQLEFYPVAEGFRGLKERIEFELGPNEDYLYSLFHVIQQTGNEELAPLIEHRLNGNDAIENPTLVRSLISDLRSGQPIEPRLSSGHYGLPGANFTLQELEGAIAAVRRSKLSVA
jgi:hypothetical protein